MQPARITDKTDQLSASAHPPRVLLVVGDPKRHALMQRCALRHLPGCHVDAVGSCLDALDRATRKEAHLLVLDLSLDCVLVPALKRFLARTLPQSVVHIYDDSEDAVAGAGTQDEQPSVVQLNKAFFDLIERNPSSDGTPPCNLLP